MGCVDEHNCLASDEVLVDDGRLTAARTMVLVGRSPAYHPGGVNTHPLHTTALHATQVLPKGQQSKSSVCRRPQDLICSSQTRKLGAGFTAWMRYVFFGRREACV